MASSKIVKPKVSSSMLESPFHFFKVILPSPPRDKKLMIPPLFAIKFGHELTNAATLTLPNGRQSQVSLKKDGRNVWFRDGWHEFVEIHSITPGYFLVFKYEKNSRFRVHIFDTTACEIKCPCMSEESENVKDEMVDSEDCVEISKRLFAQKSLKWNCKFGASLENSKVKYKCDPGSKKRKKEELAEKNESDELDLCDSLGEMGIYVSKRCRISAEGKKRAIRIARLLKLKNPTFMVILLPRDKHYAYVPAKFANEFFSRDAQSVKVQVLNETERSLHIHWRHKGGFFLSKGWAELSKDKKLAEGDICVFQLIRKEDVLLKLSIFHA
ncbi:B3 domain-containing transcription factor VRN1 [Citrus sinensis]|uniref:B3 domain-containing transcription factor VRN1 n=3 Tax=Citrus TaxID=2706 RepID=A0ACB8IHM0_CITSI|nr:B3 domain-containing transcription factor VRN1 [Citrus sinensis]